MALARGVHRLAWLVLAVILAVAAPRNLLGPGEQDDFVKLESDTGTPQAHVLGQTKGAIDAWEFLHRQSVSVACTADAASKRTCLFSNVCFIPTTSSNSSKPPKLIVALPVKADGSISRERAINRSISLLTQHLEQALAGQSYTNGVHITAMDKLDPIQATPPLDCSEIDCSAAQSTLLRVLDTVAGDHSDSSSVLWEQGVTVLWRPDPSNQESFGHTLINEAYPLFMVLNNHFSNLPHQLQVIVAADWQGAVLSHTLKRMITHRTALWKGKLEQLQQHGRVGVCFRHLLLGDGGYIGASRASLSNGVAAEANAYSVGPSFFSSKNWLAFRAYTLQVAGVVDGPQPSRPLILLNDKRYHEYSNGEPQLKHDRRMILDIDSLAASIQQEYPYADVVAARFRDLSWSEQLELLSRTSLFLTIQGSSGFRWVWLRPGAMAVVLGTPGAVENRVWKPFHELDKWFPLSYVSFFFFFFF